MEAVQRRIHKLRKRRKGLAETVNVCVAEIFNEIVSLLSLFLLFLLSISLLIPLSFLLLLSTPHPLPRLSLLSPPTLPPSFLLLTSSLSPLSLASSHYLHSKEWGHLLQNQPSLPSSPSWQRDTVLMVGFYWERAPPYQTHSLSCTLDSK